MPGSTNDEEALYAAAGLNYGPRQSLFTNVNELALVAGLPPALVDRALPFVTVFNGSAGVDATIAAPEVIAALPGKPSDNPGGGSGERLALSSDASSDAIRSGVRRRDEGKKLVLPDRGHDQFQQRPPYCVGSGDRARRQG